MKQPVRGNWCRARGKVPVPHCYGFFSPLKKLTFFAGALKHKMILHNHPSWDRGLIVFLATWIKWIIRQFLCKGQMSRTLQFPHLLRPEIELNISIRHPLHMPHCQNLIKYNRIRVQKRAMRVKQNWILNANLFHKISPSHKISTFTLQYSLTDKLVISSSSALI